MSALTPKCASRVQWDSLTSSEVEQLACQRSADPEGPAGQEKAHFRQIAESGLRRDNYRFAADFSMKKIEATIDPAALNASCDR
jgi:hypothetical protein